jgi:hypothetical protein
MPDDVADTDYEDEEEEEDRVNNAFVTMDLDESSPTESDSAGYETGDDDDLDGLGDDGADMGGGCGSGGGTGDDIEDLMGMEGKAKASVPVGDSAGSGATEATKAPAREMVTRLQRKALTKEGYKIIGSHSAVKLCRWTKNQMRGRGGCYKHTCYGITSYQCMEATPSLACANKCVFCWRHHKNPVGTDWRWKTDEPADIVAEAIALHQGMYSICICICMYGCVYVRIGMWMLIRVTLHR